MLLLLALLSIYRPADWLHFPSMDEVRCISAASDRLFIAVPKGVYVLDRSGFQPVRTLTEADGIQDEVRLCAYNPSRGDLLIATDDRLYQYLPVQDLVTELSPPFKRVRSIGIAAEGAYFDTEQGFYRKERLADEYKKAVPPDNVTWYGEQDSSRPEDYVFLVPYYLTDNQLNNHRMTLVYPDPKGRRLYVAAQGYGVTVYNLNLGLPQHHIRLGPAAGEITRITAVDNRLWFTGYDWTVSIDQPETWSYYRTRAGDLPAAGKTLLSGSLLDLQRRERINAILPDSLGTWLGTDEGLYLLGPKGKLTRLFHFGLAVNGLARFGDSLLLGTDAGLYLARKDSLTEILDPFDRTGFGVYSVCQTEAGDVWLGTLGGLLRVDRQGDWEHIIPPGFDLSRPVTGLAAYGDIVFFDNGSGITAYAQSDTSDTSYSSYCSIDRNSGLPDDRITSLYADDRYLWIATPGALSRFDYRTVLR